MKQRKKLIQRGIAVLSGLLFLFAPAVHAKESPPAAAEDLTASMSIRADVISSQTGVLADGNRSSKVRLPAGEKLTITSESPISSVYLVWDHAPDSWQLLTGSAKLQQGEVGYLHHYIELPSPCTGFQIVTDDDQGVLCDIYLFGEGTPPDWVQQWQPPWERADMLVFPTHADDELLFFGGTMPYYAGELGYKVQVAYLTNHYGEPYRPHELLNGLWTVGIRAYPVISDFPDYYSDSLAHAKTIYNVDEILGYQTEVIRRFRPYVVIGQDLNGEYGHGVHQLNSHGLLEISDKLSDPAWYPESAEKYGTYQLPKLYLHLYPENQIVMDWDVPLEAFGGKTGFEMASEGFACHVSQQAFKMARTGVFDSTRFGLAYTSVGPDIEKNDFFENIVIAEPNLPPDDEPESSQPSDLPEPEPATSGETENPNEADESSQASDSSHEVSVDIVQPSDLPEFDGEEEKLPAWVVPAVVLGSAAAAGIVISLIVHFRKRR